MTNDELWQAALGEIELSISKANFVTWFKNTAILSNESGRIVIGVPNGFAKEWLENKYNTFVLKALRNFQNEVKEISCVIYNFQNSPLAKAKNVDAITPQSSDNPPMTVDLSASRPFSPPVFSINSNSNLNPRYLFSNFVVGESNELAKAACFAVSQNLGRAYNPLFIYGGVGLGKTHLLQSIGNEILLKDPNKKIKYITSERFANELIDAIRNQKADQFKKEYQQIDLLIIDDVQFLSGKEKTQQEFFHVFNALYQLNKQIVISSDRPPKAIPTLEERLRSRFEGGMIADVGKPELETRMAILKIKANEKNFFLKEDVARFIAENIKNNIRELEGALNKVIASCELENTEPTLENVPKMLGEIISSGKKKGIQFQDIVDAVSSHFGIEISELINKGRKSEIAKARQIAMFLMRSELSASYPSVGDKFGGRDHTTALHAYEKINKELAQDEKLREIVTIIREKIYSI
jgi:chromosomal replication initiator protein